MSCTPRKLKAQDKACDFRGFFKFSRKIEATLILLLHIEIGAFKFEALYILYITFAFALTVILMADLPTVSARYTKEGKSSNNMEFRLKY